MSDEFLKTIQAVQSTGQAPSNQSQTTKESTATAKMITESQQRPVKTHRLVLDEKKTDVKNDEN